MTNAIGEMRDWAPIFRFGVEAPVGAWTLVLADAAPSRRRKGPFSAAGHPVRRGEAASEQFRPIERFSFASLELAGSEPAAAQILIFANK